MEEGWRERERERSVTKSVIFGYLFQLTGPDINSRVAITVYQNSLSLSLSLSLVWWYRGGVDNRYEAAGGKEGGGGSPGGSRYVFSEATRSSTPSSEKFCLHPLPFIGDIYRLILLFHSSKFKHSKNPPPPRADPVATSHDNWIGPASKLPFLSSEYNLVEKTAWPIQRHRLFLRRESFFAAIVAILDATKKKEREGEIENNKGNTFLSNFSFLELSRELSLFWDWESSEEKRAKPRESKPIR